MILDNESQRKVILAAIASASWSGEAIEIVFQVKRDVMSATIAEEKSNA